MSSSIFKLSDGGLFVAFEGIDGSGKSTQAKRLANFLQEEYKIPTEYTFEPTDKSPWGRKIRSLAAEGKRLSPHQELELFIKDRKFHLENIILPAVREGRAVVQDRYFLSSAAYQGAKSNLEKISPKEEEKTPSKGPTPEEIIELHLEFAPLPDIFIFLDIPAEIALERLKARGKKLESFEKLNFLKEVSRIYRKIFEDILPRIIGKKGGNLIQREEGEGFSRKKFSPIYSEALGSKRSFQILTIDGTEPPERIWEKLKKTVFVE